MFKEWQLMTKGRPGLFAPNVSLCPQHFSPGLDPDYSITTIKQLEPRRMEQFQPNFTFCGNNFHFILVCVVLFNRKFDTFDLTVNSSSHKDFRIIMTLAKDPI